MHFDWIYAIGFKGLYEFKGAVNTDVVLMNW